MNTSPISCIYCHPEIQCAATTLCAVMRYHTKWGAHCFLNTWLKKQSRPHKDFLILLDCSRLISQCETRGQVWQKGKVNLGDQGSKTNWNEEKKNKLGVNHKNHNLKQANQNQKPSSIVSSFQVTGSRCLSPAVIVWASSSLGQMRQTTIQNQKSQN